MATTSPYRVAARFLLSGTIEVPKRIHQEVEDWAIANWALDEISHQTSAIQGANRAIVNFQDQITKAEVLVRDLFRLLDSGDLQGAKGLYADARDNDSGFHHGRYWPKSKRYYVKVEDLVKDPALSKKKLKPYLKMFIKELTVTLQEEVNRKEALESEIAWLKKKTGTQLRLIPEKDFVLEGDETKYPPLKGKVFQFTGVYKYNTSAGSWTWDTKTLTVTRGISEESAVRSVVRHELQHAMQNFLRDSLGYDSKTLTRDVGLGPRKVKTPWYTQHGLTTTGKKPKSLTDVTKTLDLHALDDIEFHTELEDARDRLRFQLGSQGLKDVKDILRSFLDTDYFLGVLASVPEARGKYQVALKELAKVLDEPEVKRSRL